MSETPGGDNSLAFVDVITNGLGGMLVLFFIVIVIQANLEWSGDASASAAVKTAEYPFVVVIRPNDDQPCFAADRQAWETAGVPAGLINHSRGPNMDWGPDYAILVAPAPLRPTSTLLSVRTNRQVTLDVEVYPAGARKRSYQVEASGEAATEVWPRLGRMRP